MTAGVVEARQELKLRVRQPATIAFQLQRKRVAPMPEQKIARTGEHAHALELRAGDLVTSLAVRNVQPQHIGLGAQAQVLADSSVYRGLRTPTAMAGAAHGTPAL